MIKKLNFKICKNLPSLLDTFKNLKRTISALVEAEKDKIEQIVLLENISFYLVVDNVKALLETERSKKCVTKLAILEQMLSSQLERHSNLTVNLICINDAVIDEFMVFREQANVFQEFMFVQVHHKPMLVEIRDGTVQECQLYFIILEALVDAYGDACPFL